MSAPGCSLGFTYPGILRTAVNWMVLAARSSTSVSITGLGGALGIGGTERSWGGSGGGRGRIRIGLVGMVSLFLQNRSRNTSYASAYCTPANRPIARARSRVESRSIRGSCDSCAAIASTFRSIVSEMSAKHCPTERVEFCAFIS